MKKIFASIVALLLAAPTFAQYSSGGFSLSESNVYYGIRLGANFAGIGGETSGTNTTQYSGTRVGMTLGGVVGLRLSDSTPVFLESGLYYTGRGGKSDDTVYPGPGAQQVKAETKVALHYLEIPILIKYGVSVTDDIAVLPFVGPYFSFGIASNLKAEYTTNGEKTVLVDEGAYKHTFKHPDVGFKIGCGAEYNKLYLELGYQFGVTNISKYDNLSAHNHDLFVNFGVNF